jgi:uncharacterized protein (UPF0332 family)
VHPDPERLLEQAEVLITNRNDETDLRRAVSAAYYALFHYALRAAADLTIGAPNRGTPRYSLAYCSVDHVRLKTLRDQLRGAIPQDVILPYAPPPPAYFGKIVAFVRLAVNLQQERHYADYHPTAPFDDARAKQAIADARIAIKAFEGATPEERDAFLTLLLFKPRQP